MSTEKPWLRFYEEEVPAIIDIPDIPLHQVLVDAATRSGQYGRPHGHQVPPFRMED